jgi:hypothetical protein
VVTDDVGAKDLQRLALAMKGADKDLKKRIRTSLRESAAPIAPEVVKQGAASLPASGGLRARVERYRTGISLLGGTSNPRIVLRLARLAGYNRGHLRHPVYGNRENWVGQTVEAHTFTDAFEKHAGEVRERTGAAIQHILNDVAREV